MDRALQWSGYSIFLLAIATPILVFLSAFTALVLLFIAVALAYFGIMCFVYIGLALSGRMRVPHKLEPLRSGPGSI